MSRSLRLVSDPLFAINLTPATCLVEIVLRGFWTVEDFARFETALRAAMHDVMAHGCRMGEQVTLFDLTQYTVQSADVAQGMAGMAGDPTIGSRRIAVILSSALLKMQARRTAPDYGFFEDRAEALAWLLDGPVDAADTAAGGTTPIDRPGY